MKSDRVVSLLLLLQGRSPRNARELAAELGVSMRTIYRDVDALCISGVPVYAQRGSTGGIALSDGYRKAIAQFSTDELHALFVAASDPLADLGVTGHERALHKLKGALPDLQRRAADKAGERILLDHRKWYRSEQPGEILATLRRAVWDDRVVEITYRDRSGVVSERSIEPLGLVSKAGIWYVIARAANGELRSFRAERIVSADETRERFARPPDFDLEGYWRSSMEALERSSEAPYEARLLVQDDAVLMLSPYFHAEHLRNADGSQELRIRFPSQDAAVSQMMMLGSRAAIIEPLQLREAVKERARALVDALERVPASL